MSDSRTDADAIRDIALAAATPEKVDPREVYARTSPYGASAEVIDLEKFLPEPRRTKGTYTLKTAGDFVAFVKGQAGDDLTIWVDDVGHKVTAVFNDARVGSPAWRDHRAVLALELTPEWEHWRGSDGRWMEQQAFAEHIEDGIGEIREPAAADMLELAQSFHATTTAEFRSATRLANGEVKVLYDEEVQASAGSKGEIPIPGVIHLALAPFVGEGVYALDARFRYRLSGGSIRLAYKLDHPERVLRDAVELIAEKLREEFEGRVYLGQPAS